MPYYRISRTSHQHRVLRQLETRLGPDVVVRYAAPAFHTYAELDTARFTGQVLAESGFVSPSIFGKHQVWSYQGPGTLGFPNPSGRGAEFERLDDLFGALSDSHTLDLDRRGDDQLEQADPFGDHLERLADAFSYRQPALRDAVSAWALGLRREEDLTLRVDTFRALVNFVTIQSGTDRLGASWHVTGD